MISPVKKLFLAAIVALSAFVIYAAVAVAFPTPRWTFSPTNPVAGQSVTFNGSASTCDVAPCKYKWTDVNAGTTLSTAVTFSRSFTAGSYKIRLHITNANGGGAQLDKTITVAPNPAATSAVFSWTPSAPVTGSPTHFDGTASVCAAAPCTYTWEDDGPDGPGGTQYPLGTGSTMDFTFNVVGTKFVRLTVADAAGGNATVEHDVAVAAPSPTPTPTPTPTPSPTPTPTPTPPPAGCDLSATPSNFSAQVAAASAGQTICLASGSYGTWTGTSKAITVKAADGATPTMQFNFGSSAANFTVDGVSGAGGTFTSTSNVTVKNSTFTSSADLEGTNHGLLLQSNKLDWPAASGGINAKIFFGNTNTGTVAAPAVTIDDNHIAGGDLDGVHIGGGSGLVITNNEITNLCDVGANHTDNIQFEGGSAVRIAGNYIHEANGCGTQGITSYDGGTNGVIIEDNVVDIPRDWGIELYQDHSSIVRHNTVVKEPYSDFGSGTGQIDIGHKTGQACGSGTIVRDNVADVGGSCPLTADHNTLPGTVTYVGPTNTWAGHHLAAGSPGKGAASDGLDTGIR